MAYKELKLNDSTEAESFLALLAADNAKMVKKPTTKKPTTKKPTAKKPAPKKAAPKKGKGK